MNRDKNLPLTETVYYVLLALYEPGHGYAIMKRVEELSSGQVRLAAGTMYGALENLLKKGLITALESGDPRRKVYAVTQMGRDVLKADCERMRALVGLTDRVLEGGFADEAHENVLSF